MCTSKESPITSFVLVIHRGVYYKFNVQFIDGLVQNCSNSIITALEWQQFCNKPSIYSICVAMLKTILLYVKSYQYQASPVNKLLQTYDTAMNYSEPYD